MAEPLVTDVPIPEPPSRFTDPNSAQEHLTALYGALVQIAVLDRQARAVLIGILGLEDIAAATASSTVPSAGYVQAEAQAVVTKLNEVITKLNQVIAALAEIKSEASTNIVSLIEE